MTMRCCAGRPKIYIATAEARDEEMQVKIVAHQARRGSGWTTVEAPRDLGPPLAAAGADEAVLIEGLLPQSVRTLDVELPHQWFWDGHEHVDPANFYFNDLSPEEYARLLEISRNAGQSLD